MDEQNSPRFWWTIATIGLILVILGVVVQEYSYKFLGLVFFGLGMSVSGSFLVKFLIGAIGRGVYQNWRGNYIEVYTKNREEEKTKYSSENKNIEDWLLLLSVSATNAIADLYDSKSALFKALQNGANIQLIILGPTTEAARQRVKSDNPDDPEKAWENMKEKFLEIRPLIEFLNKNDNLDNGILEIRATNSPINSTIYCHSHKLIFGSYIPDKPGGGSYAICRKLNPDLYLEYKGYFEGEWARSRETSIIKRNGKLVFTKEFIRIESEISKNGFFKNEKLI